MGKRVEMSDDVLNQAMAVGVLKCPDCGENMMFLEAKVSRKHEWYCKDCHLSVPAFEK